MDFFRFTQYVEPTAPVGCTQRTLWARKGWTEQATRIPSPEQQASDQRHSTAYEPDVYSSGDIIRQSEGARLRGPGTNGRRNLQEDNAQHPATRKSGVIRAACPPWVISPTIKVTCTQHAHLLWGSRESQANQAEAGRLLQIPLRTSTNTCRGQSRPTREAIQRRKVEQWKRRS